MTKTSNQYNASVKTTLDLPADLVRQVKLRALHDGKKLKDAVAELLRRGLAARRAPTRRSSRVQLPLVQCKRAAELTPARIAAILVEQDAAWHRETSAH